MKKFTTEFSELNIDQLDRVSGGDMAINLAVKAYEDMGKRLVAAVHKPVTQPKSPMQF